MHLKFASLAITHATTHGCMIPRAMLIKFHTMLDKSLKQNIEIMKYKAL